MSPFYTTHKREAKQHRVLRLVVCLCLFALLLGFFHCSEPSTSTEALTEQSTVDAGAQRDSYAPPEQRRETATKPDAAPTVDKSLPPEAPTERRVPDRVVRERRPEPRAERKPEEPQESRPERGPDASPLQQALHKAVLAEYQAQGLTGLAVGAMRRGKWVFLRGYGMEDRAKQIPIDPRKTLFRWASISKTFAGVVALQLVAQKKLDLDAPIQRYYKSYVPPKHYVVKCQGSTGVTRKGKSYPCVRGFATIPLDTTERVITTRQLLGHLGGIAHYTNGQGSPLPPTIETNDPRFNKGIEWALKYLLDKPLIAVPGEKYSYTTFGFNLLGVVLEKAAGQSFAKLVADQIAKPAQITSLQPDYEWNKLPRRAVGYRKFGTAIVAEGSDDVSWKLPGGGFISTAYDMGQYCLGLMDERLLSASQKRQAWTSQKDAQGKNTNYGLGFTMGVRNGHRRIGHSGSQQKTRTNLRLYPKDQICLIVLTNAVFVQNTTRFIYAMEDVLRRFP